VQADQPYAQGSGPTCGPFEGFLPIRSASCADASGERRSARSWRSTWIWCRLRHLPWPALRPEALAQWVLGPYGITDLTNVSVADTLERNRGP